MNFNFIVYTHFRPVLFCFYSFQSLFFLNTSLSKCFHSPFLLLNYPSEFIILKISLSQSKVIFSTFDFPFASTFPKKLHPFFFNTFIQWCFISPFLQGLFPFYNSQSISTCSFIHISPHFYYFRHIARGREGKGFCLLH